MQKYKKSIYKATKNKRKKRVQPSKNNNAIERKGRHSTASGTLRS